MAVAGAGGISGVWEACQSGSHDNAEARCLFSPWAMSQVLYWAVQNFGVATGFYVEMTTCVHISLVYTNAPRSFIRSSQKWKTAQKLKTTQMSINRWQVGCYSPIKGIHIVVWKNLKIIVLSETTITAPPPIKRGHVI